MVTYIFSQTPASKIIGVKIGKSSRPVDIRSKELDNTAVPLPFEIYAVMRTEKYNEAEHQIHNLIDLVNPDMRIRKGREFFNVTPETALRIFQQCALTLNDAEIIVNPQPGKAACLQSHQTSQNASRAQIRTKSQKLTFAMLSIPVGSELVFVENPAIKAYTYDDANTVILEDGTHASLSRATAIVKRQLGTAIPSDAYQGGKFWLYRGERLTTLRNVLESDGTTDASSD